MNVPVSNTGDPAWEIATLFPAQGFWTDDEFLRLDTNRLIELNRGHLEVLPAPTELHQLIAGMLSMQLAEWAKSRQAGIVLMAPMKVRVAEGRFREPDVMFLAREHYNLRQKQCWLGADFVVEVISDDDPNRDLVTKRAEYGEAGISEYWIVDPRDHSILVLKLDESGSTYEEFAQFSVEDVASSVTLEGFQVSVRDVFTHE